MLLRSLDDDKCASVKQISGTCISLKSPIMYEIFFTKPHIHNTARNGFLSVEDFWMKLFFSHKYLVFKLNNLV